MAQITTQTFGDFKFEVGDGATPTENFSIVAGLTSKGVTFDTETVTTEAPDATDENLPSFKEQGIKSQGMTFTGSGMWAAQSHGALQTWWKNGTTKNVRLTYMKAPAGTPKVYLGPAVLTSLQSNAEKGGKVSGSIAVAFAAMPTITNAP